MQQHQLFVIGSVGLILDFVGKLLVSYTAVRVHQRVWKEHRIDDVVFNEMKNEARLGIIGICLMMLGFLLESIERYAVYFF